MHAKMLQEVVVISIEVRWVWLDGVVNDVVEPSWVPTTLSTKDSQYMCHVLELAWPDVHMTVCIKIRPRASQCAFWDTVVNHLKLRGLIHKSVPFETDVNRIILKAILMGWFEVSQRAKHPLQQSLAQKRWNGIKIRWRQSPALANTDVAPTSSRQGVMILLMNVCSPYLQSSDPSFWAANC